LGECLKAAAGKGADGGAYIGNALHKLAHGCFLVVFTWLILTVRAQPNREKVIPLRDLI
jgi:hypothetical protein